MTSKEFGHLLKHVRLMQRLSQSGLARRSNVDASYINRLESGQRKPSRETLLALADALGISDIDLDAWLLVSGYAPMPVSTAMRGSPKTQDLIRTSSAVRTRGGMRTRSREMSSQNSNRFKIWERLQEMGLVEVKIHRLMKAFETAEISDHRRVAETISATITRIAETLESPVRTAVIPAAGGQHRVVAAHVMQRLLLKTIAEAAEAGITNVVLVLAPGTIDTLYLPIKEVLSLALGSILNIKYVEQSHSAGLGDAILRADEQIGKAPFAVLLPDEVLLETGERSERTQAFKRMMQVFKKLGMGNILSVAIVPKSKMSRYGVAILREDETIPGVYEVEKLVEKPQPGHPILQSPNSYAIAGRYILKPTVLNSLIELKSKVDGNLQLTDALEMQCQKGDAIFALKVKAIGHGIGTIIENPNNI